MGQAIAGNKQLSDNAPVAGSQFGYAFDGIGNRTSATVNGRTGSYTANTANQYTQRQVPGFLDIRGTAIAASKVTVNHQPTQRQGDTFYKALAVDNSTAAQFPEIKVLAVQNNVGPNGEDLQSESIGKLFLPQTPEVFTHDAEGNLTSDGRWNYTWDAENRMIQQETIASVPAAAKRKLEYSYDTNSRRIRKQVFNWNGTAWALQSDRRFLYDGWNLVAELDSSNSVLRTFVWGTDLSGTMQGAGGVGGLLAIREGTESCHPAFDGNGNVTALVKASDHSVAARYQYGPFGETLVVQENGVSNPFRFSTKYYDPETGLYYYGFRYYDPVTGRWKSQDPIEEEGGLNLYGFANNDSLNRIDKYGLDPGDTINVERCQVYIYYGHLSKTKLLKWVFNGRCNLGGAIGCYPSSNSPPPEEPAFPHKNVPENHQIPGLPNDHNDQMAVMDGTMGARDAANGRNPNPEAGEEHGMPIALENFIDSIEQTMDKLCDRDKCCCSEVKLTIHVDNDGNNNSLQRGIDRFAPRWKGHLTVGKDYTKTLKCGIPAVLP